MRDVTTQNLAIASVKNLRLRERPRQKLADLAGILEGKSPYKLTIAEMNEVIARGWAGKLKEDYDEGTNRQ